MAVTGERVGDARTEYSGTAEKEPSRMYIPITATARIKTAMPIFLMRRLRAFSSICWRYRSGIYGASSSGFVLKAGSPDYLYQYISSV